MNRGSRYGRPLGHDDLDALTTQLRVMQRATLHWLETQPAGANPAGDQLCDAAAELGDVLTQLIQYSFAPSVQGLYIIK